MRKAPLPQAGSQTLIVRRDSKQSLQYAAAFAEGLSGSTSAASSPWATRRFSSRSSIACWTVFWTMKWVNSGGV